MADRRQVTLLQLAIAASMAIVPVLLGVLLVVASARDDETGRAARTIERHVSVRHVAALKTFERAIVRRDRVASGLPTPEALLERFPQCHADWMGRQGLMKQVRTWLARTIENEMSPAARMALQLEEVDRALLRFSSVDNRRVVDRVGLDGGRWLDAVAAALETPVETAEYPGHQFRVQCSDIRAAIASLARSNARMLEAFGWRGTEVDRVVARWRPDQFVEISARNLARSNPWSGVPGCVYLAGTAEGREQTYFVSGARGLDDRLCTRDEMSGVVTADASARPIRIAGEPTFDMPVDDPRWKVPPSLSVMLQPLETLRRPGGALYGAYTEPVGEGDLERTHYRYGPNRIDIGGNAVDVGFSIDLTIAPEVQALAQQTAACYTGRHDVCRALGLQRKEDGARAPGHRLLEQAMVRMAAIAVVDVESGRIEALAGTLSPCTGQEYDGPGRSSRCDRRIPYPIRYRPDALLNPAVFHDAMPASTIKPIMAAAFLSDAAVGLRWLSAEQREIARSPKAVPSLYSLRWQLMRSDSAGFLDRAFCADKGFGPCDRLWTIQSTALAFGWNAGCTEAREGCGKRDLLFGRNLEVGDDGLVRPLALEVSYGRLLTEPLGGKLGAPFRLRAPVPLDNTKVRQCAAGADGKRRSADDWEKCGGGVVVDVVAEGWGQGHARASAVGSAGMMSLLAAAANGQARVRKPHLVDALRGAGPADTSVLRSAVVRWGMDDGEPNPVAREAAEVILSALSFGHRAGTSRLACEQVFDARTCSTADWIAGKTGTPTFPNDDRTLDELKRLCSGRALLTAADRMACGPLRPYKWYVAAYRTRPDENRWTKVIAVLVERNWVASTGRIHGAGDHGPNPAAEIAMQIAARHAGLLPWSAP